MSELKELINKIFENEIKKAREIILKTLKAKDDAVVFCASGSEANNLSILSGAEKNRRAGNRIITTDSEHPSVAECMTELEKRGFDG